MIAPCVSWAPSAIPLNTPGFDELDIREAERVDEDDEVADNTLVLETLEEELVEVGVVSVLNVGTGVLDTAGGVVGITDVAAAVVRAAGVVSIEVG